MDCSTPGPPVHHQLPELTQTHVHCISDAIQPSHPLSVPFSSCLQSCPASGSFQMSQFFESKYWSFSFSFSISPSNEHSGLISFMVDWLDSLQSKYWSQSIGASASVLPMNVQGWFPLGWTCWISLQSKGLSRSLFQLHSSKASILLCSQSQTTSQSDHTDHSLSNSVKLSHAVWGHPRRMGHDGEVWQNVVHWRREWQTTSVLKIEQPKLHSGMFKAF